MSAALAEILPRRLNLEVKLTKFNPGVKMRLVWVGWAVWEVLAIADESGGSVKSDLEQADPSDGGATQMLARLETEVPLNGPPLRNRRKCVDLGHGIYELKEWNWRVLWFYDTGEPKHRKRIICSHSSGKVSKKEFQPEIQRARRMREEYMEAKASGRLIEPLKPEVRQ